MKYLESVKMVQFFLYEKLDLPIRQITGVVGPNGSGKSTAIDAIQISIFGGHGRWVALNSQADDQHMTRTLRTYCLGQYGDMPEQRARDTALTYLTLIWRDTETGMPYSTGVCIYASADRDKHEVLGRYVLEDIELSMGDHLETVDGEQRPRPWEVFRQSLIERSGRPSSEILFKEPERYLRSLLMLMRDPSRPAPTTEAFVRSFRFGLRMRFDKSVDDIVRNDVLESRPTNISRFKDLSESFRKLAQLVADVEEKIHKGQEALTFYDKAVLETTKIVTWQSLEADSSRELSGANLELATAKRQQAEAASAKNEADLQVVTSEIEKCKAEEARLRTLREAHASHQYNGVIQANLERVKEVITTSTKTLRQSRSAVMRVLAEASRFAPIAAMHNILLDRAKQIADAGELDALPKDSIAPLYSPAAQLLKTACDSVMAYAATLVSQKETAERRLKELEENLQRAREGKAPLRGPAAELLTTLRDNGLSPQPVCDLVRITDEEWQPVIEAYLGTHRQALLTLPGQEQQTFAVYRRAHIFGAKVAMASRQRIGVVPPVGSVAELIVGELDAAVAYLRSKFGDIRRVTSDDDAMSGGKTLTKDGMFVTGSDMDRIRPLPHSELCIGARGNNERSQIQTEITSVKQKIRELTAAQESTSSLYNTMRNFADEAAFTNYVLGAWQSVDNAQSEYQQWLSRLEASADEEYVLIGRQLEAATVQLQELTNKDQALRTRSGVFQAQAEQSVIEETTSLRHYERDCAVSEAARAVSGYDPTFASENWDKLLERFSEQYQSMKQHCREQASHAERRKSDALRSAENGTISFVEKYKEQVAPGILTDWPRAHTWLRETIGRLERTDLVQYKDQMDSAYRASQETFRQDVAVALYNNIQWLDDSIERLNKALRTCPSFTNGERYQFIRKLKPKLENVLNFIKDVATYGPTGDMFGAAGDIPEQFQELLTDKVSLGAAGARSPLDDYREFFEFDIEIQREDPITKLCKKTGLLSKRIGTGSGGEHRSPLYVIAGAAIASAYRMDEGNRNCMGLILLDEAFNRMDFTNIMATMRYLEDLGLQIVLASPGENIGVLTAFFHRYYDIQKDPDNNVITLEGHDVSAEVRALYRADIPDFNPGLIEREVRNFNPAPIH